MDPRLALAAKLVVGFGVAALAVLLVDSAGSGGEATPPLRTLFLAGLAIGVATTTALYLALRWDLGLPASVAFYAVGYNALVVLVKFVLAPHGFYEVNQEVDLDATFAPDDPVMATLAGLSIFCLYGAAYWVIYRLMRRRLDVWAAGRGIPRREPISYGLLVPVIVGVAILAVMTGGILIPLIFALSALEYLEFVFSSSVSLLVALALAGATALAAIAFRSAADRAQLVGNAAVFVGFFWLGLAFLALYHALWVVYVLVLTSIWPLKVVVPK